MTEDPIPPYGTPSSASTPPSRPEPGYQPVPADGPVARNEQHITILGGLRRTGRWSVPRRITAVSLIGGVDLDLRDALLPPGDVVLQHFSLIGGVEVRVPANVDVRVEGLRLLGGQSIEHSAGGATTTLIIRSFGILGGIQTRRA